MTIQLKAIFHVAEAYRNSVNLDHDKKSIVLLVDEIGRLTKERDDLHAILHNIALYQEKQAQGRLGETHEMLVQRVLNAAGTAAYDMPQLLCEDCPPVGYPTDKTRCDECPRRKL